MIIAKRVPADQFPALARKIRDDAQNLSMAEALREMKRIGERAISANFDRRGRSTGEAWAPRKRRYRHPILEKTGRMRRSATTEGAAGHVEGIGNREAHSGTSVFYSIFHQLGTSKMVARPFEELPDSAVDAMEEVLVDWCQRNIFAQGV